MMLQTISLFAMVVTYCVMCCFVFYAIFSLRQLNKELFDVKKALRSMLLIVKSEHLRNQAKDLDSMNAKMQGFIHNDQYEEAERLKTIIDECAQSFMKGLSELKKEFGDEIEIKKISVGKSEHNDKEDSL